MSVAEIAGLGMLVIALVTVIAALVGLVVHAAPVRARADKLQRHPVLVALQSAQTLPNRFADLPERIAAIRSRTVTIAEHVALLLAASALLRSDVKKIGRATETFLETFVPGLRGSL